MMELTMRLQQAYVKAGESMGKEMAAAIVATVSEAAAGQGMPLCMAWPWPAAPEGLKDVIPKEVTLHGETKDPTEDAAWVVLVDNSLRELPLFQGIVSWRGELTSGHVLLVLT